MRFARSSKEGDQMQMGPALLPTPLSPMRGRVPSTEVQGTQTWHPMFSLLAIRRWSSGSVTGARTGIRSYPPLGPVLLRHEPKFVRLHGPAALQRAVPQPDLPLVVGASSGCIAFRSEDLYTTPPSASGRVGLAHNEKPSYFRHRPALHPACAFSMRVSKSTRTDPAASFRSGISQVFQAVKPSRPEAFLAVPMS